MKRSKMHCKDFLPLRVIGKVGKDDYDWDGGDGIDGDDHDELHQLLQSYPFGSCCGKYRPNLHFYGTFNSLQDSGVCCQKKNLEAIKVFTPRQYSA